MKSKLFFVVTLFWVLFISTIVSAQQEEITLSTYYPAPYGEYDELCAEKLLVDLPSATELQDMARGDCHITRSLIVGSGIGSDFSYDRLNTLGTPLYDGDVIIKGYVGIGTSTFGQYEKVHIAGPGPVAVNIEGTTDGALRLVGTTPPATLWEVASRSDGRFGILQSGVGDRFVINTSGNVGIGTTEPGTRRLQVVTDNTTSTNDVALEGRNSRTNPGTASYGVRAIADGTTGTTINFGLYGDATGSAVRNWGLYVARGDVCIETGNVGIGTTSPTAKLHIGGTAGTDGIMFPDGTIQTSSPGSKRCRVYNTTAQSIPNGTWALLNFDSESWDTDNIHSGSSSRLTCTTPGLYFISGSVHWELRSGGRRVARIRLNGTTFLAGNEIPPPRDVVLQPAYVAHNVTTIYYLSAGDYVEFSLWQSSGSALNTLQEGTWSPSFMMVRIGD